ncbi:hypothetical protein DB88DRAFT_493651 [Papiliotrema laurentii]|uniref:Ribosome assembly protein 3 n=1 Tax=Papiliotrema laurentii TaxID=5418 RepID=A0AAD9FQH5_PAPLA|nr:hypothetical protein DB88DRAFT_493651 [Papiliotrema laurentii]
MAPASTAKSGKPARKRRRRQLSYSPTDSSSSDSDSSDSGDTSSDEEAAAHKAAKGKAAKMDVDGETTSSGSSTSSDSSSSSSSSSSSDSDSSSDDSDSDDSSSSGSDSDEEGKPAKKSSTTVAAASKPVRPRAPTLSPSPPPRAIPSFLSNNETQSSDDRRARFRRVYMEKLVEGFGDDLEKLRTSDPTLGPSKLQLLIDSLASGIDIFSDPQSQMGKEKEVDEVGLILGDH